MYSKGLSYSVINSAKCAIASIVYLPPYSSINNHPTIKRYMKGIYNLNPPKPKLTFVWDVSIMFKYFKNMGDNTKLTDKLLSQKLIMLLLLLGGQRLNTLVTFHVDHMIMTDDSVTFVPDRVLKHSRSGKTLDRFQYRTYVIKELCVISCLREYLQRRTTKVSEKISQLVITHGKPYREASIDTLRRWVKELFIQTNIINFTPHSCRAASTSKAKLINVNIDEILHTGCWKNEKNFLIYYNKEIKRAPDEVDFYKIMES